MGVDVETRIEIARPREDVARIAADVANATAWYENIQSVEWPLAVGSRVTFVAEFLGRRLMYLCDPGMDSRRAADHEYRAGTVPDADDLHLGRRRSSGTLMILRNRGEPTGFTRIGAPLFRS